MTAKNYFFTKDCLPTKDELAKNKKLGFVFINGKYGNSFNRECGKVAGFVPEHLKHLQIKRTRNTRIAKDK